MHPTYSLDQAPSVNYLFLPIANEFAVGKFVSREAYILLPIGTRVSMTVA